MKGVYKTPGVYIEEKNAFTTSIVAVPTAIPAFIGYTEKAVRSKKSVYHIPTRIQSFKEFEDIFGNMPTTKFDLTKHDGGGTSEKDYNLSVSSKKYFLYQSMKLFFTNGGGACWIVSVGDYEMAITRNDLEKGLNTLLKTAEPTMLVMPDAMLLPDVDCYALQNLMIEQGGDSNMRDRIAILDVHGGFKKVVDKTNGDIYTVEGNVIEKMRGLSGKTEGVGNRYPDFGAVYYPWVEANVISLKEVSSANLTTDGLTKLIDMIETTIDEPIGKESNPDKQSKLKEKADKTKEESTQKLVKARAVLEKKDSSPEDIETAKKDSESAEKAISTISPLFREVLKDIKTELNTLPPSGAIAGMIAYVDNSMGVAKAPANTSLSGVVRPMINISNEDQEDLNLPLDGKAVNAIRSFPGRGVMVWGARTLDGNSQDWRYINVRRAVIMIEQSIKIAMDAFVFEPNNQNTWLDVQGSITNFLTAQWSNGVLAGATPSEAFEVSVGLGSTMTPNDIVDGIMRISVKIAIVRPAEFIVITFQQKMQTS